jgi:hypothetical protein
MYVCVYAYISMDGMNACLGVFVVCLGRGRFVSLI